jgi:hypothetical protein
MKTPTENLADYQAALTAAREAAKNELFETYARSIVGLRNALAIVRDDDHVFVWPKHWLAVRLDLDGRCQAVSVDKATLVTKFDKRVFYNGHRDRAELMSRRSALWAALHHTQTTFADIQKGLKL